jgi:hypothetical protein
MKVIAEIEALIQRLQRESVEGPPPAGLLVLSGQSVELAEQLDHMDALVTVYAARPDIRGKESRSVIKLP